MVFTSAKQTGCAIVKFPSSVAELSQRISFNTKNTNNREHIMVVVLAFNIHSGLEFGRVV